MLQKASLKLKERNVDSLICGNQMKRLLFVPLFFLITLYAKADDHNFKSWNDKQFKDFPFECVEDGVTQEYTRCYAEKLNKYDWELKKELNDDKSWKLWRKARWNICYHYKTRHFGQGTIKPLMTLTCEMRLNSEVKRFCLSVEDKRFV